MEIFLKEQDAKGFAMALVNEKRAGAMTYSVAGEDLIIIDHTEVEPEHNGKGLGRDMLYKIVEMAREKDYMVIPIDHKIMLSLRIPLKGIKFICK